MDTIAELPMLTRSTSAPPEFLTESVPYVSMFFHPSLALLWDSYSLAHNLLDDMDGDRLWEVAVEIGRLRELGLSDSQLRWLALKGYVACKDDDATTLQNGSGRLRFESRSLLVLTRIGYDVMKQISRALGDGRLPLAESAPGANGHAWAPPAPAITPHWDCSLRELWVGSCLVKRFKGRADNQALVLCAFEEENWSVRIDDPLPPHPRLDSKLRLRDTISSLNRHQSTPKIRFHGDGTGRGVRWEPIL